MSKSNDSLLNKIHLGDCLELLTRYSIPKNSVIVTDPPFNMGKKYNSYNDRRSEVDYYGWLMRIFAITGYCFVDEHYPAPLHLHRIGSGLS